MLITTIVTFMSFKVIIQGNHRMGVNCWEVLSFCSSDNHDTAILLWGLMLSKVFILLYHLTIHFSSLELSNYTQGTRIMTFAMDILWYWIKTLKQTKEAKCLSYLVIIFWDLAAIVTWLWYMFIFNYKFAVIYCPISSPLYNSYFCPENVGKYF